MIDIFNHFMPKTALERVRALVPDHPAMKAFPELPTLWDVDERLRMMDEFDGLQQVLSLANPPLEQLGAARADAADRAHRERRPGRAVPAPSAALSRVHRLDAGEQRRSLPRETDRAVKQLGARGIQLFTNVLGKPLSRARVPADLPPHGDSTTCRCGSIRSAGANSPDYATEKTSENEIWFTFGWPYETTACMTRSSTRASTTSCPGSRSSPTTSAAWCRSTPARSTRLRPDLLRHLEQNPQAEKAGLRRRPWTTTR